MTTPTTRPARTRLPLSAWVVAVVLPLIVWATAVAVQLAWLPRLPDPVALHWGTDGAPDGFGSPWATILLTAGLGAGLTTMFGLFLLVGRATAPTATHKLLAVISLATSVFTGILTTASLGVQLDLADAHDAAGLGAWIPVALGAAALVAVLAWLALPRAVRPGALETPVAPLPLTPGERSVWLATATLSRGLIIVIVSAVGLVTAGTAAAVAVSDGLVWPLLLLPLVLGLLCASGMVWRVRVDPTGLTVVSLPLRWPRSRIRIADIATVKTVQVEPFAEFGGWGWRWSPVAGLGVVARAGDGILVTRRDGRRFTVTVDDAATGAALLAGYAADR